MTIIAAENDSKINADGGGDVSDGDCVGRFSCLVSISLKLFYSFSARPEKSILARNYTYIYI